MLYKLELSLIITTLLLTHQPTIAQANWTFMANPGLNLTINGVEANAQNPNRNLGNLPAGTQINISWQSTNATQCQATSGFSVSSLSGSTTVQIRPGNQLFSIRCDNIFEGTTLSTTRSVSLNGVGFEISPSFGATPVCQGDSPAVRLNWDQTPLANLYLVQRNGVEIFRGNALSFIDSGVVNGSSYTYTLRAYSTDLGIFATGSHTTTIALQRNCNPPTVRLVSSLALQQTGVSNKTLVLTPSVQDRNLNPNIAYTITNATRCDAQSSPLNPNWQGLTGAYQTSPSNPSISIPVATGLANPMAIRLPVLANQARYSFTLTCVNQNSGRTASDTNTIIVSVPQSSPTLQVIDGDVHSNREIILERQ